DFADANWALAIASLAAGDYATYRSTCQHAIASAGAGSDPGTLHATTWFCSVGANAVEDHTKLRSLGTTLLPNFDLAQDASHAMISAAAIYRGGDFQTARIRLQQIIGESDNSTGPHQLNAFTEAYVRLFLSMTEHQLGNHDRASKLLASAIQL